MASPSRDILASGLTGTYHFSYFLLAEPTSLYLNAGEIPSFHRRHPPRRQRRQVHHSMEWGTECCRIALQEFDVFYHGFVC